MIDYDNSAWIHIVFTCAGSVWPSIRVPFILCALWIAVSFGVIKTAQIDLGDSPSGHMKMLGITMAFVLIFRANQAYARYWEGRGHIANFFDDLRSLILLSMLYAGGGLPAGDETERPRIPEVTARGQELRVDIVRLSLALAVGLKMHTRLGFDGYCMGHIKQDTKWCVDWDRLRLCQLLKDDEFSWVDGLVGILEDAEEHRSDSRRCFNRRRTLEALAAQFRGRCEQGPPAHWPESFVVSIQPASRAHLVLVFLLQQLLSHNIMEERGGQPWGIQEKFVPSFYRLLCDVQASLEEVNQIITTPLPLPYACLCKTLLLIWMLSFPFVLDFQQGAFGGFIVPLLVALALLGIDAIATELENPFGDDANDLDLLELICNFEEEAMAMLALAGDHGGRACFVTRRTPPFIAKLSSKPVQHQLVVKALAADEVVDSEVGSNLASHRSGRSLGSYRSSSSMHDEGSGSGSASESDDLL